MTSAVGAPLSPNHHQQQQSLLKVKVKNALCNGNFPRQKYCQARVLFQKKKYKLHMIIVRYMMLRCASAVLLDLKLVLILSLNL